MFGSRVRFGVTYKTNQTGFDIYCRKYEHNFRNLLHSDNFLGSKGC